MRRSGWLVVVPLKGLAAGKRRLRPATGGFPHERLVLALASDTVRAALGCPVVARVLVVTGDPAAAAALGRLGAQVLPEPAAAGGGTASGPADRQLNRAVRHAAGQCGEDTAIAVLTADLPALRSTELAAALRLVGPGAGFVADACGTGTTLLAAPAGVALRPSFGAGSAARHAAAGAQALTGDWPGLRRDVDTPADLAQAAQLGLGPATAGLWRALAA